LEREGTPHVRVIVTNVKLWAATSPSKSMDDKCKSMGDGEGATSQEVGALPQEGANYPQGRHTSLRENHPTQVNS
jgi:hypothetical protein